MVVLVLSNANPYCDKPHTGNSEYKFGRYLIDVPSLDCDYINECLSFGDSIEECYNESKAGD